MGASKICSIDGCGKPVIARSFCCAHWSRWKRHGSPLGGGIDRGKTMQFLQEAFTFEGSECLIWPYAKDANGYAQINYNGRVRYVQREICEQKYGPAPKGHVAAHSCGKGHLGCINPRHLRWATRRENYQDSFHHETAAIGEKIGNAKLNRFDIPRIIEMRGNMTQREVAEVFGVSRAAISDIERKRNWSWVQR